MSFSISGYTAPGFEPVRAAFVANFAETNELGASFCAVLGSATVVDLWGGYCDHAQTKPWEADTVVNVYSTTKGLAAAAVAGLVESGALSYEAPVGDYWPQLR